MTVLPNMNSLNLVPISCSGLHNMRIMCSRKAQIEKIDPTHATYTFHAISRTAKYITMKDKTCPDGFSMYLYGIWCFMLLPLPEELHQVALHSGYCGQTETKDKNILNEIRALCQDQDAELFDLKLLRSKDKIWSFQLYDKTEGIGEADFTWVNYLKEFYPPGSFIVGQHNTSCFTLPEYNEYIQVYKNRFPHALCSRSQSNRSFVQTPSQFAFTSCDDGSLIPRDSVCDGKVNCYQGEDEKNCTEVCSSSFNSSCFTRCEPPTCFCNEMYYQCFQGGCILFDQICNGYKDCLTGEDEEGCLIEQYMHSFKDNNLYNNSLNATSFDNALEAKDQEPDVMASNKPVDYCEIRKGFLSCFTNYECYHQSAICQCDTHYSVYDSRENTGIVGQLMHCRDGTHLGRSEVCRNVFCINKFKCKLSYCIPVRKVCDGVIDCPDGEDEMNCSLIICPQHLQCVTTRNCVPPWEICDGTNHCLERDDERFCQICPAGCICRGNAVKCRNMKYLEVQYEPKAMILEKSNHLLFSLLKYFPEHLKSMHSLSLFIGKYNESELFVLNELIYLRQLQLINQGLISLERNFLSNNNLQKLNLSNNQISIVKAKAFANLGHIKLLSLSSNKLTDLKSYYFEGLTNIQFLYLENNNLIHVSSNVFLQNEALKTIRSNWYIVCCVAQSVSDCQPQQQSLSSCTTLLPSAVERVIVFIQCFIALIANTVVLVFRIFIIRITNHYEFLISVLTVLDLLMGIYLLVIVIVDFNYYENFNSIVSIWSKSAVCMTISVINFVSSQGSLLILLILSVAKFISVTKVRGMKAIKMEINIGCALALLFLCACVSVFFYGVISGDIYLRNNMCIILGILDRRRYVASFEVIFQLCVIVFNVISVIIIVLTASGLFYKIMRSHSSVTSVAGDNKVPLHKQKRLQNIARRIAFLIGTNLVCWIPSICVNAILVSGYYVPEIVLQWMVIFIIPISATTDPILYNSHIFKTDKKE